MKIGKIDHSLNATLKPEIIFASLATFLSICVFYLTISIFKANIPVLDDFAAILEFINKFLPSNWHEKIILLFSQYNEHRVVFLRLLTVSCYYITGKVDFRILTIIGHLSLIGLLIIFLKSNTTGNNTKKYPYFIIPLVLLLFQPQYYETSAITMAAVSNLFVLFFAFLSLYLLTKRSTKYLLFSLAAAISATFTNGNGMLVFLAGLIILVIDKRFKESVVWLFVGITCVMVYFIGYLKPSHHPSITASIFIHPIETIKYFLLFLGSYSESFVPVKDKINYLLPLLTGALSCAYFIFLLKVRYYKMNKPVFSFLLYLFLTVGTVSLCRSGFGLWQALSSRYTIISVLMIISFYFSAIEILSQKVVKTIFPILLVIALFFNLFSYYKYFRFLVAFRSHDINSLIYWKKNNSGLLSYLDTEKTNAVMSTAIEKKYYSPPIE